MKSMRFAQSSWIQHKWRPLLACSMALFVLLLAGCGSGNSATNSSSSIAGPNISVVNGGAAQLSSSQKDGTNLGAHVAASGSTSNTQQQVPAASGPQYLIKTLKVSMIVNNTRDVADTLQSWIKTTDPRASTAGADYEQTGNNLYNVTLTFAVQASIYPQIYNYLRDFVPKQGGQLQSFTESVQDVSNDYVDTQSRLKTLRIEQQRVQTLLGSAQKLSDVLILEQKLSDVEGQIETIEEHLNQLTSQVTFYNVSVVLQPTATAPAPPSPPGWNAGQIFHEAFAASLTFAQSLTNFLIWLLAFSFYIIPTALIVWFVWRVRNRPRHSMPKSASPSGPTDTDI